MEERKLGVKIYSGSGGLVLELGAHVLTECPLLAAKIGQLAAEWAHAEAELSAFLAALMQTSPERTFALLAAYKSASATADAARSLARATLKGPHLSEFEAIIVRFKDLADERNKIQHGLWAKKETASESLFRVKALRYAQIMIELAHTDNPIALAMTFAASLSDEYTPQRLSAINGNIRAVAADIFAIKQRWTVERLSLRPDRKLPDNGQS